MTLQNIPVSTEENTPIPGKEKIQLSSDADVLLMLLIDVAEGVVGKATLNITLFVQGLIVTGVLIGEKAYFEGIYNEMNVFVSDSEQEREKDAQTFFAHYQSLSLKLSGNQGEESQLKNFEYIHLKNAQFYAGNSLIPTNKKPYWRGNLSRVDGFCLGNLTDV